MKWLSAVLAVALVVALIGWKQADDDAAVGWRRQRETADTYQAILKEDEERYKAWAAQYKDWARLNAAQQPAPARR